MLEQNEFGPCLLMVALIVAGALMACHQGGGYAVPRQVELRLVRLAPVGSLTIWLLVIGILN